MCVCVLEQMIVPRSVVPNLGSADPLGVYITVNGGGPRSPKIGHRRSRVKKG